MVNSSYFLGLHVTSHLPQIADAMSSNMAAPYKILFNFGNIEILNYSYFTNIMTRENQKLASWLKWPSSIHFWS